MADRVPMMAIITKILLEPYREIAAQAVIPARTPAAIQFLIGSDPGSQRDIISLILPGRAV